MTSFHTFSQHLAALLLAIFFINPAAANEPVILGSYAYPSLDRERALAPLATLVGKTTGHSVKVRLYKDPDEIAAAVANGEVDVAVLNLGAWLRAASAPGVLPLAVLVPATEVQDRYRAVLVARPGLGLTDLEEVAASAPQLTLAAVLPGSSSGGLIQLTALSDASGASPRWRSVVYAGSHEAALTMVAKGEADLAAIAETPWRTWLAANPEPAKHPKELWRSAPLPPGPVACRPSARIDCQVLADALTSDEPNARSAATALAAGWPELAGAQRFVTYEAAQYAALLEANRPH